LTINDLDFDANEIIVNKTLMWKAGNKKLAIKGRTRLFVRTVQKLILATEELQSRDKS